MKLIAGGVTAPKGFRATGVICGIKKIRKDLALIYSEVPGTAAGTFTTNQVKAAPVVLDIETLKSGKGQAILANSGNANACTGKPGMEDALKMQSETAEALNISPKLVYVASTGVIGHRLPMSKVITGIHNASKQMTANGGSEAAQAIMTTDRIPKEIAVEFELNGKICKIGGMTKGAGMIAPEMTPSGLHATMLCFLTTDVSIKADILNSTLAEAVEKSFNCVTVDNDRSTNDTVIILANGLAENKTITKSSKKELVVFKEALSFVCLILAKLIAKDGEGATKLIEVVVNQAKKDTDAKTIAFAVANSPLVKTAVFGRDANWGRILCAVGYTDIKVNPDKIDIHIGGREAGDETFKKMTLVKKGIGSGYDELDAKDILSHPEILIEIDLHLGKSTTTVWTCDFSLDYVKINASYRS